MNALPGHSLPNYSEEARNDALFHYTTANGLIGILTKNEIWSTAYYCANDESELSNGKDVLTPTFRSYAQKLIQSCDPLVELFRSRGIDVRQYANGFENHVLSRTLNTLCAYITCFFKPSGQEDFTHGLLSQWRGYGIDGGYALQFSRRKLDEAATRAYESTRVNYTLQDVYYQKENPLRTVVMEHQARYEAAFRDHLDDLAKPLDMAPRTMRHPAASLFDGPLEALLDYLIHTKSSHFAEERECRLCLLQAMAPDVPVPLDYFNRAGMIVPYTKTPKPAFNILDCVDWIVIGPAPRMEARFNAVAQLVKASGRKILVRPSHIPLARQ